MGVATGAGSDAVIEPAGLDGEALAGPCTAGRPGSPTGVPLLAAAAGGIVLAWIAGSHHLAHCFVTLVS